MPADRSLFCPRILLPDGWAADVLLRVGEDGRVATMARGVEKPAECPQAAGPVIPAVANLHSHAFQRAMAGMAETAGPAEDSFWTWRETMYRLAGRISPEQIEAVATKLYMELMRGGFGHVVEFHYLHRARGADSIDTSRRILAAARRAGIGLTHLPVFYAHSGFGGAEPNGGQGPFLHDIDGFLALLDALAPECAAGGATLGLAFHSLRAATPGEMHSILAAERTGGPIHVHLAEQEREVEDCLAHTGRRPVDWLLDEMPVDARWCAVHATHMTADEIRRLARSGAVAGLCPATEANLGDGIFPANAFLGEGGAIGIGTDSHVATDVADELRLLEYGQRLRDRRRGRIAAGPGSSVGRTLLEAALTGGHLAAGLGEAGIRVGARADLVVLDGDDPFVAASEGDALLDRWIFALGWDAVRDVMVAGRWTIRDRRHEYQDEIDAAFRRALLDLG